MSFFFTHSRWKLEVLDLRDAHHDFWNGWAGLQHVCCSPDVFVENQPVENHPILEGKHAMIILMNLSLMSCHPSNYLKYFYRWAKQRKNMIQVICKKLKFGAIPAYNPLAVLKVLDPGSIQELVINSCWDIYTLALLAPGLGQMKNLQKLLIKEMGIPLGRPRDRELEASYVAEIFHQFSNLHKLRHLYLNDVCFVNERLDQVLR